MCGPILQQTVPEAPPLLPSLDTTLKGLAHRLLFPRSHPDLLFQHTLSTELTLLLATYMICILVHCFTLNALYIIAEERFSTTDVQACTTTRTVPLQLYV